MVETTHLIGLLLGTEEDWPRAFETLVARLGPVRDASGGVHRVETERITIEPFDLHGIAEKIGYPLFMKPYDGGQWVGVTRIRGPEELSRAYDASGQRLMHLQASVEGYDVFARSLSIGPETMVMDFRPDKPMHERYAISHDFLSSDEGFEVLTISRLINAFFRWEFNSCECLV